MASQLLGQLKEVACAKQSLPAAADWVVLFVIALPHFLYAFVWLQSKLWQRIFGSQAVTAFAGFAYAGKVLQLAALVAWVKSVRPEGLCLDASRLELSQFLTALLLFAVGQSLNAGIYSAIGTVGVYYGTKLGHKVPWVSGWPFSAVSHPQYVGSVLSVWAIGVLLYTQVPPGSIAVLVGFWTSLYVVTGAVEQYL